jgi:hypothetical protein
MTQDLIRYDLLAQNALRGVIRAVLADGLKMRVRIQHRSRRGAAPETGDEG